MESEYYQLVVRQAHVIVSDHSVSAGELGRDSQRVGCTGAPAAALSFLPFIFILYI